MGRPSTSREPWATLEGSAPAAADTGLFDSTPEARLGVLFLDIKRRVQELSKLL